jgi:glucose/arabinose dehydrogenase
LLVLLAAGAVLYSVRQATAVPDGWPRISVQIVAEGFSAPTYLTHAGDGSGRLFVTEQEGRIRILQDGVVQSRPFLDITDRVAANASERGLLSVAFPPDYASKGYFYVNYTRVADSQSRGEGNTIVARYRISDNPDVADAASERVILEIAQPEGNHNGGQLAFGPDGYLYIGMGDGGGAGDPEENAQDTTTLLGKLLRIDVESGVADPDFTYSIPADNPFTSDSQAEDEIWALGLRNPWRFSFDRSTGDLYIGDVGQSALEEVDFQPASSTGGENYGWDIMEGTACFEPSAGCDTSGLTLPVAEYPTSAGCAVTGGYVYRGTAFPALQGIYLYADYCTGQIWGLRQEGDMWQTQRLFDTFPRVSSFGEDEAGEVYVLDLVNGRIGRIELVSTVFLPHILR